MAHSLGDLYEIKLEEPLAPSWSEWFGNFTITLLGHEGTLLTGCVQDQTELHRILKRIRDLNLTLISISRIDEDGTPGSRGSVE
jgi:hypothetical protein